jgi:hypothetical protein
MSKCIICGKIISIDRELCDEHRPILESIAYNYNQDPEIRRAWDNILHLIESKKHSVTNNDIIDEVFDFIDEINR